MSGSAYRLKIGIFIPDIPPTPLHILIVVLIYSGLTCKGAPEPRYAPSQFIPFHPFLSGGILLSCCRTFLSGVPFAHAICGVSRLMRDAIHTPPGKREGLIYGSRLQPSHGGGQNLLGVKAAFATLRKTLRCFALTRKFLTAAALHGWRRLLALSQPERRWYV
jgi:hypothetical protein